MARIRSIKPEFFQDAKVGAWPLELRLFYIGLWTASDDYGRFRDAPTLLLGTIFPYDDTWSPRDCREWLARLSREGRILAYEVAGERYWQILRWDQHQRVDRPSKSGAMPAPPRKCAESDSRASRDDSASEAREPRESLASDRDRDRDQDREGETRGRAPDPPSSSDKPSAGESAGPERAGPPNLKRETAAALNGGMMNPDHNTARDLHEHYRAKFADPATAPSWATCREAMVRAVVWCRHDGLDPGATLRRVLDYCAETEWRSRGQGTADRLFKVRSIFGDAEHCAETLGTLIAEVATWKTEGARSTQAAPTIDVNNLDPRRLDTWPDRELVNRHPIDWKPELRRRHPDLATWHEDWLDESDVEMCNELERRRAARPLAAAGGRR